MMISTYNLHFLNQQSWRKTSESLISQGSLALVLINSLPSLRLYCTSVTSYKPKSFIRVTMYT